MGKSLFIVNYLDGRAHRYFNSGIVKKYIISKDISPTGKEHPLAPRYFHFPTTGLRR